MALVITDNSPSAGYIAWAGLVVTYKSVNYNVNDSNSNKRYIWWDLDNPNDLQESDIMPTMTKDDAIIFINVNGSSRLWGNRRVPIFSLDADPHPSGMIHDWGGTIAAIPSGWLLCNGASLERVAYADLFTAIGIIHGAVDGSHFNLPDLRDVSIVGAKQDDSGIPKTNISGALTQTGGAKTHTLSTAEMPSHAHGVPAFNGGAVDTSQVGRSPGTANQITPNTNSTGGGGAHNNLSPYKAMVKIIKT